MSELKLKFYKIMSTTKKIFSFDINGSITERFFNRLSSKKTSKRNQTYTSDSYIDKSKINQTIFLKKQLRKLSDFKDYDISPTSTCKNSHRSRICLKQQRKIEPKNQYKFQNIFQFQKTIKLANVSRMVKSPNSSKKQQRSGSYLKNSGLLGILRESSALASPRKSKEYFELNLSKRKLRTK